MITATATADSTPRSSRLSRTIALARAELTQFLRNPTLLVTALLFPLGLTVAMFVSTPAGGGKAFAASLALETSVLTTMLLVVYYSVLSMSTTRRDEKVLKRLRTGEAKDSDILVAIAAPSSLLAIVLMVLTPILLIVLGAPAPVTVIPFIVAVLEGLAVSAALGFLTSAFTTNAEAAQITSLPVLILAIVSQSTFRALMPEEVARIIDRTPFALMGDLAHLTWSGTTVTGGFKPLESGAALATATAPMLVLALWAVALLMLVPRVMKWESNR